MHQNGRRRKRGEDARGNEGARGWCRGSYPSGSYRRSSYSCTTSGAASGRPDGRGARDCSQRRHRNHLSQAHDLCPPPPPPPPRPPPPPPPPPHRSRTHSHTHTRARARSPTLCHRVSGAISACRVTHARQVTLTRPRFCPTRTSRAPPAACPTHGGRSSWRQ
eukprot:COSAG02_NODE_3158_length_7258_cov_2.341528_2_plen_163_part_00